MQRMKVVVITNEALQQELLAQGVAEGTQVVYVEDVSQLVHYPDMDAYIDLLYTPGTERTALLQQYAKGRAIVHLVGGTLQQLPPSFIRINAWPGFLQRNLLEASSTHRSDEEWVTTVFALFNKQVYHVPDKPGFITARVVSMVINEAFLAHEEGVSTREEIDTAMKLGTNYPYGPFAWADKIGIRNVAELLTILSNEHDRYTPAQSLTTAIS